MFRRNSRYVAVSERKITTFGSRLLQLATEDEGIYSKSGKGAISVVRDIYTNL